MQKRDTAETARVQFPRLTRRERWGILAIVILCAVEIGVYYAAVVYPRRVSRYEELSEYIGRRITFETIHDDSNKAHELVFLEGQPIRFSHTMGGIDWTPQDDEYCIVVGTLEHEPRNMYDIPYCLTRAEYFPISEVGHVQRGSAD
ncbi:MAG: hypothetical protein KDA93_11085 [Planctomycetaceae bacterium]|nr:hypothetical protein [Planctomycetaceae bacterium]